MLSSALVNLDAKQLNSQNGALITAQNLIGGLRAINAPFFPADCILITTLSNLAIYFKQNTARLFFKQECTSKLFEAVHLFINYSVQDYISRGII